jgi:hypothetical protein
MRAKMQGIKSDSVYAIVDELAKCAIVGREMAAKCANHKNFHPRKMHNAQNGRIWYNYRHRKRKAL